MNLSFKTATQQDIPVIKQLADKIWPAHYSSLITADQVDYMMNKMYSANNLKKQMEEGHLFHLVYLNELPAGYISLSNKGNKNYILHKFYVLISEHGKGVGSALFTYALNKLKDAERIELTVNRQNINAINFYFKKGFIIEKTVDFDIGDGYFMNDFIMIKKLNNNVT